MSNGATAKCPTARPPAAASDAAREDHEVVAVVPGERVERASTGDEAEGRHGRRAVDALRGERALLVLRDARDDVPHPAGACRDDDAIAADDPVEAREDAGAGGRVQV